MLPRRSGTADAVRTGQRAVSDTVQAGRAAVLLMGVGLLTGFSNLTFNVLVARRSGADAYGAFVALLTLSQIAGVLAVATNYTVARRVARADHLSAALIRRSLLSSWPWVLVGAALFAVTPLLQSYVHLGSPAAVLTADSVFIVIVTAAVPNGILIGLRRFRTVAVINFVGAVARLAVVPFLPTGANATVGALAASALPFLIIGPTALTIVIRSRRDVPVWRTERAGEQDAGALSVETMGAALMAAMLWSLWTLPPLMARNGLTGAAAGDFSAAQLLAGGILFLSAPAVTAFFPITARGRNLRTALLGLAGLLTLCASAVVFLALLGPTLMPLLFGSGYSAPLSLFAALGTSATLVAAATFCTWMTRAMSRLVWVAFAGSAVAVTTEIVIGFPLHPPPLGLALLPATAVLLGLAVVTAIVPEAVYSRATAATRRTFAEGLAKLPRRSSSHNGAAPPRSDAVPEPSAVGGTRSLQGVLGYLGASQRRLAAVAGVGAIAMLGITGEAGPASGLLAAIALAALLLATALALAACRGVAREWIRSRASRRAWTAVFVLVAIVGAAAAQSWFRAGTAIAGTDLAPPDGTAWLARIFDPWSWTGSDIGSAAANQRELPWGVLLGVVHALGGSAALAQRLWFTLLFAGIGVGAVALLRTLGLRPVAAAAGGLVYLFNPNTLVTVPADVFLLALALLPALTAIVLAAARGSIRVSTAVVLMVLSVPLLGYVEAQPALFLMLAVAVLLAPLLAGWLGGRDALVRGLRVVAFGGGLVLMASAFWLVPAAIRTGAGPPPQLAGLSSWAWTEVRATVANGFWLNTTWGWNDASIFPYSTAYGAQPLQLLKFALPALAFAALLIPVASARRSGGGSGRLRTAAAAAATALFIIVFATGTNAPGALIFDPVYFHLPFGFLVREPDSHFMAVAALAYAVLIGVGVDHIARRLPVRLPVLRSRGGARVPWRAALAATAVGVAALVPSYPLLTGAVLPDTRPGYPPRHVTFPSYWYDMANFVNASPNAGDILALPADHFYQADYTWGYYGTDTFIQDLLSRRVLMALPEVYVAASRQLQGVVDEIDADIVGHHWTEVGQLASALRTPFILVRGDVDPGFHGASGVPDPSELVRALAGAPGFELVKQTGPLELFRVRGVASGHVSTTDLITTVNSANPDLNVLPYLPVGTQLVTAPARAGLPNVAQIPSVDRWTADPNRLVTTVQEPPGWSYQVAWLNRDLAKEGTINVTSGAGAASLSIPTTDVLADGDFARGLWQEVNDCNGLHGFRSSAVGASVGAHDGPGGSPALNLGALLDTACEQQPLTWKGGSLVLSMSVRNETGPPPRVCVYESAVNRCATASTLPTSAGWMSYSSIVSPDPGTRGLTLYLLADGSGTQTPSLDQFAEVRVRELPIAPPNLDLVATPASGSAATVHLVVQDEAYDERWSAPGSATHVRVDGLLNGWLTPDPGPVTAGITYGPDASIALCNALSLNAGLIAAGVALWAFVPGWRRRFPFRPDRS